MRIFIFTSVPSSLYVDEVAMLVDASLVANFGRDMHDLPWWQLIYPSWGDYKQALYIWSVAAAVKLLGTADWVVKIPSLFAGLLTIFVSGLVAVELLAPTHSKKRLLFLITAAVTALSPWGIIFSRAGFEGNLAQLLLTSAMYCYLRSKQTWLWLFPTILLAALSTYTYYSVRFVFPLVFSLFVLTDMIERYSKARAKYNTLIKESIFKLLIPLSVYALLLIPLAKSPFASQASQFRLSTPSVLQNQVPVETSNQYRERAGNTVIDRLVFHRSWLSTRELLFNYSDHLSFEYLFISGDSNFRHGTGNHGLFLLVFLPFFLLGWYGLVTQKPAKALLLFGWWLAAVLPAAVPQTTPHALRSLNALVPLSIVIAYGLYYFFIHSALASVRRKYWQLFIVVTATFLVSLVFSLVAFGHYYFYVYPQLSDQAWFSAQRTTAQAIKQLRTDNRPVYAVNMGDTFHLWVLAYVLERGVKPMETQSSDFKLTQVDNIYPNATMDQLPPASASFSIAVDESISSQVENKYGSVITQEIDNADREGAMISKVYRIN